MIGWWPWWCKNKAAAKPTGPAPTINIDFYIKRYIRYNKIFLVIIW